MARAAQKDAVASEPVTRLLAMRAPAMGASVAALILLN